MACPTLAGAPEPFTSRCVDPTLDAVPALTEQQLNADLTRAMKAREMPRVYVLRGLLTAIKNRRVERRGAELGDADLLEIVRREIRQRDEAEGFAAKAGRPEIVAQNRAERATLRGALRRTSSERDRAPRVGRTDDLSGGGMELPVLTRLKRELTDLKHELTVKLPKELEAARAHGDLSENAEYEAAKNRQDFVRSRIAQLEGRVRELSMYNISSIPNDVVAYGSRVTVEDDSGQAISYEIVFPEEVDAAKGQISLSSPIGRALISKTVGDEVVVQTPSGKRSYQIIELVTLPQLQAARSGEH